MECIRLKFRSISEIFRNAVFTRHVGNKRQIVKHQLKQAEQQLIRRTTTIVIQEKIKVEE